MIERVDLNEFVGKVNQLAPLPAVALRVLQLAEDERSSANDLASIIATDQAMTAKLLRLANSAYFAAGREITTVRDAIVLLGMVEIRRLVLTTALMGQYTTDSGTLNVAAFWGHALAVGMVAEVMARNTKLAVPEEAFTAGILHDIGKLVMAQYLKDHFDAAATFATTKGIPLHRSEAEVFGFDHALLGKRLAEAWRLPPGLVTAIAHHHASPGQEDGLSYIVYQANELCRDHGLWCGFEEMEPGATPPTAGAGTDDPIRAAALAKLGGFEKVVERANSFLSSSPIAPVRRAPVDIRQAMPPAPPPGHSPRSAPWAVSDRFPDRFGPFKRRA
jgi:putative nucleotidyltransferase with HDIG domain